VMEIPFGGSDFFAGILPARRGGADHGRGSAATVSDPPSSQRVVVRTAVPRLCLAVPPALVPMSDMPGAAVAAVVGAQTVGKRPSGHEMAQMDGGVTLPLMCPLASARPRLGASRGHIDPPLPTID
jgi:hypothetical protein